MEFVSSGIKHIFANSGVKIMDAKAFDMPLNMLINMSNQLFNNKSDKFDIFMSMLEDLYNLRIEEFNKCDTFDKFQTFHASILRDSCNVDLMADSIAKHAMQFLDDYSKTGNDYKKFSDMCELVFKISRVGMPID